PASRIATTCSGIALFTASVSRSDTAAIGLPKISANPLIAANPTRSPVNDPGPDATAKPPISPLLNPCFDSRPLIWGTNCAENVPPSKGTMSITEQFSPLQFASAMLPFLPDVSAARRSMNTHSFDPANARHWCLAQRDASTNSNSTPPALEGCTNT